MQFHPYPKIHTVGYRGTEKVSSLPVYVSEKLDGSNVSLHCFMTQGGKVIRLASRTRWLDIESKQFTPFIQWAADHLNVLLAGMEPGEVLWGEFCNNHNVLKYDRKSPFVLFDFSYTGFAGERIFQAPDMWRVVLEKRNLQDVIPIGIWEFHGLLNDYQALLEAFVSRGAYLGGPIEGIVIKNYSETSEYSEPLFVKLVMDEFKEGHKKVYAQGESLEESLCQLVFNEARFRKGVQRVKENEQYTGTMKDMGTLLSTIQKDVEEESMGDIATFLVNKYWPSAKKRFK